MNIKYPKIVKQRDNYIKRIMPFMRKNLVKVLTGHRRVGKSYILFQLMDLICKDESEANIIYINVLPFFLLYGILSPLVLVSI